MAQPNGNVRMHFEIYGRFFRIHVCQGADLFVRVYFRGTFRKLIEKPVLGTAHGAVVFVYGGTLVALQ